MPALAPVMIATLPSSFPVIRRIPFHQQIVPVAAACEQPAERRGNMLIVRRCVQQIIKITLICLGDEPPLGSIRAMNRRWICLGDEPAWLSRSTGLLEGQKIQEGLSRAVERGIALAPQIGDEQFPADSRLSQFADSDLGTPQFGNGFGQQRYS